MSIPVVPALIPQSLEHAKAEISRVGFSNEIQVDLVDGVFAPTTSWPYEPVGDPMDLKYLLDKFTLEVDLMVQQPIAAALAWLEAGADMLIFHVESLELEAFKNFVQTCNCTVGVAAHGDTTVETIAAYAAYADYIQLMGIREIGAQGQPFDETVLDRITALRRQFPDKVMSVDGSVNLQTIEQLKAVGVNRMVVGSGIFGQTDAERAHQELSQLIN